MSKQSVVETTKKVDDKQGYVEVSRTDILGGMENKTNCEIRKIKIRPFVTQTATVSVKKGTTIPTEPYASVRLDVMISCPCYIEEIVDVYTQASELADDLLDREIAVLNGETPVKTVNTPDVATTKPDATVDDLTDTKLADIPVGEPDIDDLFSDSVPTVQSTPNNDTGDDIIDDLLGG